MNYNEYRTQYQKVMLKETLKKGITIKQKCIDVVINLDKQVGLELLFRINDFDGIIMFDKFMLADLGDDDEFKEIIENDIKITKELKKTAENRLRELKEQNRYKENDNSEKDNDGNQEQANREEEYEKYFGKAQNSEGETYLLNNDMENYQDMRFTDILENRFQTYGSQKYYISNMKFNVMRIINNLQGIKMNVDMCHSPMMITYIKGEMKSFDSIQELGRTIQEMPECDEQLGMLAAEQIKVAQELKNTINKYIEQYQQKNQENLKSKGEEVASVEENKKRLKQGDELKDKENEQQKEKLEQEDEKVPKKSWELSPKQKEAIQISTQQVAKDYMERQDNTKIQIEENVKDNLGISR